jgi:hypothetical protein
MVDTGGIFLSVFLGLLSDSFSQMARCVEFLRSKKLIGEGESFFSPTPNPNAPLFITAWIMDV